MTMEQVSDEIQRRKFAAEYAAHEAVTDQEKQRLYDKARAWYYRWCESTNQQHLCAAPEQDAEVPEEDAAYWLRPVGGGERSLPKAMRFLQDA